MGRYVPTVKDYLSLISNQSGPAFMRLSSFSRPLPLVYAVQAKTTNIPKRNAGTIQNPSIPNRGSNQSKPTDAADEMAPLTIPCAVSTWII